MTFAHRRTHEPGNSRDSDAHYHFISLVNHPVPAREPAPVRNFPAPRIAELVTPRRALRVPKELQPQKKVPLPEVQPPKVELAAKLEAIPDSKPASPKQLVRTNVFTTGSSATPTMAAAPQKVQTGGLGDPNGVPARDNPGHAVTIARLGSFDMPAGPGVGNGTGGAKGARGVVASAGFGNGVAIGDNSGRVSAGRGTVRQGGFGDADVVAPSAAKSKAAEPVAKTIPAEITFKPRPIYTDEGRRLKVEGEVLLEVVFTATGQIRIQRVVQGWVMAWMNRQLGCRKIQFAGPQGWSAFRFQAVLHIVFQLAS